VGDLYNFDRIEIESENYIILKGRFKAVETNTFGLFIIFFNEELKAVENLMAIASHYSSLFEIDPHLPWHYFEENIINLKWKGDIALNISIDLQNYMESSLERDRGYELFTLIKNNDEMKIETLLQAILIKPLSDRNLVIETVSEIVSKDAMRSIREEEKKPKTVQPSLKATEFNLKGKSVVDIDLILAPVSGIPIYELSKGDKIMVKINDKTTNGKYFIDMLGARVEGNIIPIPAKVIDIKRGADKEYHIFCKLDKGTYGKAVETEQVKLKRYEDLLESKSKYDELPILDEYKKEKSFPIFTLVLGGLIFIILIVFVIMWFYNI